MRSTARPWLLLIAALSGPVLRQVEAADDFARALSCADSPSVRQIDGGVGDDSGEGALVAPDDLESGPLLPGPVAGPAAIVPLPAPGPALGPDRRHHGASSRPPDAAGRRQARLQVLRN